MKLSLVRKYFEPKNILDIGANVGQWHRHAKLVFSDSKFTCVEGNVFCKNLLFKNNCNSIISLLGKDEDYHDFFLNTDSIISTGSSLYLELTDSFNYDNTKCIRVKTKLLDNLFPVESFDLIKLDTQGSEIDILKGGIHTLRRSKGCIIEVSHKPYNKGAPLSHEVVNFMLDNDFYLRETLSTNERTHQSDYFFINEWWLNCYEQFMQE